MSVGHRARRKFGGPEIYSVPRKALKAGFVNGKRVEKARWRVEGVKGGL